MPITSWEGHLEAMMVLVQVKALRGFVLDRKVIEIGEVVTVGKGLARTLIAAQQAVLVEAKPEAPKPSPVIVRHEPDLATQVLDQQPRRKPKD